MNNLIDLTPLGIIKVEGADAEKFLQGQLTCDMREVTEQQSRLGAHCDHKGRIQATFRIFKHQADYYLQIPQNLIEHLLQCLKKYAVFSKVKLTDVSQDWQQLGICGKDCEQVLQKLIAEKLPANIDEIITANKLIIICLPGNTSRFCLLSDAVTIASLKQNLLAQCQSADFNYWQLSDITAGVPSLFPETIGLFTPQEINYTRINGVSFNKGCYTGQEIIARMHYLGKLKQQLYKITFNSATTILPGAKLISEQSQSCGTLVQTIKITDQQWTGLATIYDNAIGQKLYIENLQQPILDIQNLTYTTENSL